MSAILPDELRAIVVDTVERIWNGNDWSTAADTYAEDVIVHVPFQVEPLRGLDEFRTFHQELHHAFPDWNATVHRAVADGDIVAMQWTIRGTNHGSLRGLPATGRTFETHEAVFVRVLPDGRGAEFWFYVDEFGIARQLGLAPSGPPPKALIYAMLLARRLRRRATSAR